MIFQIKIKIGMFFVLKFGFDEELLFNANCCMKVLLENIKKRCKIPSDQIIDLADEQAQIKNLSEQPEQKYASLLLQPRTTYILVRVNVFVDERTGDTHKTYTALVEGLDDTNPEFLIRLAHRRANQENSNKERDMGNTTRNGTRNNKKKKGHLKSLGSAMME